MNIKDYILFNNYKFVQNTIYLTKIRIEAIIEMFQKQAKNLSGQ